MQTPRTLITSWCLLLYASIRAWLAPHACCRFHPTCSAYWAEACQRHGFFIGCLLTGKRLLRCHPWTKMQVDPVPTHIMPSCCHQTVTSEEEPNS